MLIKSSEMSGVSFLKAPVVSLLFGVIYVYILCFTRANGIFDI